MAEENIKIGFDIDTNQATQNLNKVDEEAKKVAQSLKDAEKAAEDMGDKPMPLDERLKQLNKTVKETPINVRKMNQQIQEYQAIALEAGRTSPIGQAALKEAAELRDRYVDIQNETKRLANDGLKLQAALDLGATVVGGFAAVQGAQAALGVESEELTKTLVQLQGAQSALMGIETIRKNLEKESTLRLVARTTATKAATTAQWLLNAAMSANPIALIATALGALLLTFKDVREFIADKLLGAFNGLKDAVGAVGNFVSNAASSISKAWSRLGSAIGLSSSKTHKKIKDNFKENFELIEEERKRREEAAKAAAQIEIDKLNDIQDKARKEKEARLSAIDFEIRKRQAAGQETARLEGEKIEVIKKSIKKEIELTFLKVKELEKLEGGWNLAKLEAQKANLRRLKGEMRDILKEEEVFHIERNTAWAKAAEDRRKKEEDEFKKQREEEAKRTAEIQELEARTDLDSRANLLANSQAMYDLQRNQREAYAAYLEQERQKELEREAQIQEAKVELIGNALSAAANLADEGTEAAKAIAAAQIIFDTWRGAQSAFATAQANPVSIGFPAFPYIQAGLAVAFGVGNLRKLMSESSSGAGAGVNISASTAAATGGVPIAPTAGSTILDQNNDNQQDNVKVFVTEADISNTQNNVNAIVSQATI